MNHETMDVILDRLYAIGALKFGNFTLASGSGSTFYLDLRYLPSFPNVFTDMIKGMHQYINENITFDVMIGIPLAGVPFASALSWETKAPMHLMRKDVKSHGLKKLIEGPSIKGKKVLLIDDLISSGHSKEFAIQAVRDEGGEVDSILVLIDRSNDDLNSWEEHWGIKLHALYKLSKEKILAYQSDFA